MATNDDDVRRWVIEELYWDPKFDGKAIAVSVDDGEVTLRGTVGSLREKREAKKSAERVYGVESVKNELTVRILGKHGRDDAELRADVLQALMLDGLVPTSIDARVDDGMVTLTGTAQWQFERDEAELVAGNVSGVTGLVDDVRLEPSTPNAYDVKKSIEGALERDAKVDANLLAVDSSNGTVTVTGTVGSWAEHDSAIAAAWAAPGVKNVEDHVVVGY
jgi:osmotically-inducible protein OsmY